MNKLILARASLSFPSSTLLLPPPSPYRALSMTTTTKNLLQLYPPPQTPPRCLSSTQQALTQDGYLQVGRSSQRYLWIPAFVFSALGALENTNTVDEMKPIDGMALFWMTADQVCTCSSVPSLFCSLPSRPKETTTEELMALESIKIDLGRHHFRKG